MDLKEIRNKIDSIDAELVLLFEKRMKLSYEVAQYKIKNNLPVLNQKREDEIVAGVREKTPEIADYSETLYRTIFELSRDYQHRLMEKKDQDQ